jgi:hypothetical protein
MVNAPDVFRSGLRNRFKVLKTLQSFYTALVKIIQGAEGEKHNTGIIALVNNNDRWEISSLEKKGIEKGI